MNQIRLTKYRCPTCNEIHDSEWVAEDCCPPEAEEVTVWQCAECLDVHDTEDEARLCCWDGETVLPPTPAELEAAGQQRLPL